jgi:hypothetical protein
MIRLEIIANHSVEENILDEFHNMGVGAFYTKFPGALGVGTSGPRMGDAVWPEENFVLVIWCEKAEAVLIEQAVAKVKQKFPDEGIKVFKLNDAPPQQVYLPAPSIQTPQAVETAPPLAPPTERAAAVDPFAPQTSFTPRSADVIGTAPKEESLGIESENF